MDVFQPVGIGSDFLGYRIEDLLGRGGMGVVYRAYDLRLKRTVALKLVAPALARDERFRDRFARESELVMSLEHPNVVPIYDAGDVDSHVYLAMRLVDGTDLGSLLRTEGALEPVRAVAICTQIAAALDAAHTRGLVHRDVKPSNVLLDASEHVYLADFGLTRTLDDQGSIAGDERAVGTPAYLAPEQIEGRPVDGRADVYSLGCVLYECLTGEPVFPRGSRLAVAWAHLEEEPPHASKRRAGLPEALDAVVGRALAKEPEERFATAGALVAAAEDALRLRMTGTSRRRALLLAGAVVIAAVAAAVATALTHGTRKGVAARLLAGPNTLAQIDPAAHKVSAVLPVGKDPVVAAGADYTVWVYNRGSATISQVNGWTSRLVETTHVSAPAKCCSLFTGPVLAADPSGAWFVEGGTAGNRALLVHVPVGRFPARAYPLGVTPIGVATGDGAVWVVGRGSRGDEILRFGPAAGRVTATKLFPSSDRIDSIAFGYGWVWALSSGTATLHRIDPNLKGVARLVVAPHSRATRPEIMSRGKDIFVSATDEGGTTHWIHPNPLRFEAAQPVPGNPDWEENLGKGGALWWYDWPTGVVTRQEVGGGPRKQIRVTRSRPAAGGPCLTSMTTAASSIWLTVAPSADGHVCRR